MLTKLARANLVPVDKLAYFAGFFDGEGCVSISKHVTRKGYAEYRLMVQVVQTHEVPLTEMQQLWGGSLWHRKEPRAGRRPVWAWRIFGKAAAEFCRAILPYTQIKTAQLETALEYWEGMWDARGKRYTSTNPPSPEVHAERERLFKLCMEQKAEVLRSPKEV